MSIVEKPTSSMLITAGSARFLGATPDAHGVNFALSAPDARKVELCLFDASGNETRLALPKKNPKGIWHGHVAGLAEGQLYGYRVYGEFSPQKGHYFNGNKLLVDPYAYAIDGKVSWTGAKKVHFAENNEDSAPYMPKCRVVDWQQLCTSQARLLKKPKKSLTDYIICETHVKGATIRNAAVPKPLRGTYAGLASDKMIRWFKEQGYNALELLPVHSFTSDALLEEKGLSNYWGYMTLGYFAPHAAYAASNRPEQEFAAMVAKLKKHGIDVIMDVVYNHTCEGNHQGPSLSIRGIDNHLYRLGGENGDKAVYYDTTGCGNSLDFNHPATQRLVLDSLRYFARLGVAGFRFDLGVTLGREGWDGCFNTNAQFFQVLQNDPVLQNTHLIWEPWDLGEDGYQLGNMPRDASWSDFYRESIRDFCMSKHGTHIQKLTLCIAGSSHIFQTPAQSINYLTAHDGSTLRDLVTYAEKHNWANGEHNNDGHEGYRNMGHEGETDDPEINHWRLRLQRFALATLALSLGVPMVPLGHESGKTQGGNTNVYCQDNPVAWIPWGEQLDAHSKNLQAFSRQVFHFRHKHPVLRQLSHYTGNSNPTTGLKDVTWLRPEGREIEAHDWLSGLKSMGALLSGENDRGKDGIPLLLLFNGSNSDTTFIVPDLPAGIRWLECFDSSGEEKGHRRRSIKPKAGDHIRVPSRSVIAYEALPNHGTRIIRAFGGTAFFPSLKSI